MSTDYYLFSKAQKKAVMVGSDGLSGPQAWPGTPEAVRFVKWAIENAVKDVVFINEDELAVICDDLGVSSEDLDLPPTA
jgi:hypothetical protein